MKQQLDTDPNKRITVVNPRTRRVSFEYPKHFTMQQRGFTERGGYYNGGFFGRNTKAKSQRVISEHEQAAVNSARKDVGHIKKAEYSTIAQRRVPKALHSMYGLPMKDKRRTPFEQKEFERKLKKR